MREQQIEDALIELAYTWGDIERMTGTARGIRGN
jgi:hypothetical protein